MNLPDCLKNVRHKYVQDINGAGFGKNAITWSLTNVTIPRNSIKAESIPYGGGHYYVSSHTKTPYDALKIDFKIDNKYTNYFTIYEWMNLIYHEKHGHFNADDLTTKVGTDAYATNIAVVATDEYNEPVIQWTFTKAFPVEVPSIELNYQKTDEINCSCTFYFSQMYVKNFVMNDSQNK
jgi:hypothetical protein